MLNEKYTISYKVNVLKILCALHFEYLYTKYGFSDEIPAKYVEIFKVLISSSLIINLPGFSKQEIYSEFNASFVVAFLNIHVLLML